MVIPVIMLALKPWILNDDDATVGKDVVWPYSFAFRGPVTTTAIMMIAMIVTTVMPRLLMFQMDDVKMDFRAEQYEQVLSLKDSVAALTNWQIFFPYRPKTTPLQDPKAWWRYAYRLPCSVATSAMQSGTRHRLGRLACLSPPFLPSRR